MASLTTKADNFKHKNIYHLITQTEFHSESCVSTCECVGVRDEFINDQSE